MSAHPERKNDGKQAKEIPLRSVKPSRGGKIRGSKYGKSPYEAPNCPEGEKYGEANAGNPPAESLIVQRGKTKERRHVLSLKEFTRKFKNWKEYGSIFCTSEINKLQSIQ